MATLPDPTTCNPADLVVSMQVTMITTNSASSDTTHMMTLTGQYCVVYYDRTRLPAVAACSAFAINSVPLSGIHLLVAFNVGCHGAPVTPTGSTTPHRPLLLGLEQLLHLHLLLDGLLPLPDPLLRHSC